MPENSTEAMTATTFADFSIWYDEYLADALEPGLQKALDEVERLLASALSERDQVRIHRISGRVKTKQRAWRKLRVLADGAPMPPVDGIAEFVHDLAGVRVTCTNLRDIEMVQAALETLPRAAAGNQMWLNQSRERDYVTEPRESGYRGWHTGIGVMVTCGDGPIAVNVEVQVRTVLQDTWGDLTHVDNYSKDAPLPPLVSVLSSRMADLLATMDDIAEDLRTELDRVDEEAVTADRVPTPAPSPADVADAAAAAALLQARWRELDQPLDLASLAWELRKTYGPEVSDEWFGHGSFKRLVSEAIPDAEFSTGRQQYLLPAEDPAAAAVGDGDDDAETVTSVPIAAQKLREIDRSLPLLEADQWSQLFASLGAAWPDRSVSAADNLTARDINRLSKLARDRSESFGQSIPRRHFDYVIKAVLAAEELGLADVAELDKVFTSVTLERMRSLRVLGENNRKGRRLIRAWLEGS